ncbi:MAG: hypothetical protein JNM27_04400 [Leptospirales bacterium]|nr:hypothetical protein [Leptospirales bacterium]
MIIRKPHPTEIVFAVSLLFVATASLQAAPLDVGGSFRSKVLGSHLEYLEDPTGNQFIGDVRNQTFRKVQSEKPSFGFTSSAFWLRFTAHADRERTILIELVSLIDTIDLYAISPSGGIAHHRTGRLMPMSSRLLAHRDFVFPVALEPGDNEIYMRFQSSGSMLLPLTAWSPESFREKDYLEQLVFGLYFGILVALALYNLFLFASVRDPSYLYYVLYVLGFAAFQGGVWGIVHELLPENPQLATQLLPASIGATIVALVQFTISFLGISRALPVRFWLLRGMQALGLTVIAAAFLAPYRFAAQGGTLLGILVVLVLTAICLSVLRSFKPARYFLLAFAALFVGIGVIALRNLGLLPFNVATSYSGQLGSAVEVILLSLALADRINTLKAEKEEQRKRAFEHERAMSEAFARFVPQEFLEILGKADVLSVQPGNAVEKNLAVLFADIRDFTTLSENMSPEENFRFINACMKRIGPAIRANGGFVDKYIGDAIMALFPSPTNAVLAAFAIQDILKQYNLSRQSSGYSELKIGIGLHCGRLMLGIIGEEKRLEGTVISDVVNTAARIESLTKEYNEPFLVTQAIVDETRGFFEAEPLGSVKLKGKSEQVNVFRLRPPAAG